MVSIGAVLLPCHRQGSSRKKKRRREDVPVADAPPDPSAPPAVGVGESDQELRLVDPVDGNLYACADFVAEYGERLLAVHPTCHHG
jgi:hypothetical protein